jgi:hypothetical protein
MFMIGPMTREQYVTALAEEIRERTGVAWEYACREAERAFLRLPRGYVEPAADDTAAILAQQSRSDVVDRDPIGCRCRQHAGRCVIETLSDGSTRHVETFGEQDARIWNRGETRNVWVMTRQGFRR